MCEEAKPVTRKLVIEYETKGFDGIRSEMKRTNAVAMELEQTLIHVNELLDVISRRRAE